MNIETLREVVRPACERYGVEKLILFGSRARGEANEESDYDFVVKLPESTTPVEYAQSWLGLHASLEDELQDQVDLILAEGVTVPSFQRSIAQTGVMIYGH